MINLNENPTSGYDSFSVGVQFFGVILNVQFLHKKIKKRRFEIKQKSIN
jgi:hypothetical protein